MTREPRIKKIRTKRDQVIRRAYLKQARTCHPDKVDAMGDIEGGESLQGQSRADRFFAVQQAYEYLTGKTKQLKKNERHNLHFMLNNIGFNNHDSAGRGSGSEAGNGGIEGETQRGQVDEEMGDGSASVDEGEVGEQTNEGRVVTFFKARLVATLLEYQVC